MNLSSPFSGLKVIELANVLAGPSVGMFFAELGADVLKIENPRGGDITRKWKLPEEDPAAPASAYFASVNWGKKHIFLDLASAEGHAEVLRLLETADLLIVNFKPGDAEKFRLDYASIGGKFPRLIYAHITGYGENDHRPAFDLALQAESGFMSMNGSAESGPLKMPIALIDLVAAHQAKEGILTALLLREKSGKGCSVHVSLYASAIASLSNQATNYLVAGHIPGLAGSLHPNIAPYGETFTCKDDRRFVLAVGTDAQFARLCGLAGLKELAADERFSTNPSRVKNRTELAALLAPFFRTETAAKLEELLGESGVPCSVIRTVAEALDAPEAQDLIQVSSFGKCVRTAIFDLSAG